ncbi:hypothetical protein D7b_00006 [Klebsiella phage VLCpiD7b]|nr:hypothetical protein D7b_00006 [Klebsiella phage VLCpiD7b]
MPRFSATTKLRTFAWMPIPYSSTKAVQGSEHGVYFHWCGKWRFTVIRGFYVTCDHVDIADHSGGNQIKEFNKCKL